MQRMEFGDPNWRPRVHLSSQEEGVVQQGRQNNKAAHVFYHVFTTENPKTLDIVKEQLKLLLSEHLQSYFTTITCCVSGNYRPHYDATLTLLQAAQAQKDSRIRIATAVFNDKTYERLTLNHLIRTQLDPKAMYLYIHTKGSTKPAVEWECVQDWRRCMEYFLLERINDCLHALDVYDTVGILYRDTPKPHYSGNFWWATGNYLQRLIVKKPTVGPDYFDPEMWVCSAHPRQRNLFPLTRAHYHQRTFRYEYEGIALLPATK